MQAHQHSQRAQYFQSVADEHDLSFGQSIRKGTNKRRKQNEGNDKELLQDRDLPSRRVEGLQQRNGGK
jgi:hypothetical protein